MLEMVEKACNVAITEPKPIAEVILESSGFSVVTTFSSDLSPSALICQRFKP